MALLRSILEADAGLSARLRRADRPGVVRRLAAILAHSGDSWWWGIGLVIVWSVGDARWRYRAVVIFVGIAVAAAIVQAFKWMVRRERPPGEWGLLYRRTDPHSFPSGHATRAIMLAVLGVVLGPAWFAALLCIWAPLVALVRVVLGVHYVSDVVFGAVLGALCGLLVPILILVVPLPFPWLF